MGEAQLEGAPRLQAMDTDRNETGGTAPRRLGERAPAGAPESDDVVRWVTAGIVAAAALLGLAVLVTIVVYALQPPGWLQTVLGLVMAAGAVVFAWLLASALRKDDVEASRNASRRR
ncbi:MAG TPA: hypothetical protein VEV43_00945 [Actinomycetota bacterium]|nr:hypothetical protein [Actinomycetota bacterium]